MRKQIIVFSLSFFLLILSYQSIVYANTLNQPTIYNNTLENNQPILVEQNKTLNTSINVSKLFFYLAGFGIGLIWLLLFVKGNPRFLTIGLLSAITARWQNYGHINRYLPNDNMDALNGDEFLLYFLVMLSVITVETYIFGVSRSIMIIALTFHMLMELGYRMGYIGV